MKVLIIGLGSIGKKHARAIKSIDPDIEIIALRTKTPSESYDDITNIYDFDNIDLNKVDFAIISNPTNRHKDTIEKLVSFKLPLFIEKPLYHTLDIDEVVNQVKRADIITYMACNLRFLECIMFIKEKIKISGRRINEINTYCGSYLPDWRKGYDYRTNYSAITKAGGGVHLDLIHELDYLYWIFGSPGSIHRYLRSQSSIDIESADYAHYVLEYKGFCASVILNYYRRDPKRSFEILFDEETWYVDLLSNQVICRNQAIFQSEQRISDTYITQMKYFIECIRNGRQTFNTIFDGYEVLNICLSDDTGK